MLWWDRPYTCTCTCTRKWLSKSIYANDAGLNNANSIRSTKLRKHVATASQILASAWNTSWVTIYRSIASTARYCPGGKKTVLTFPELGEGQPSFPTWQSLDELHVTGGKCTSISILCFPFTTNCCWLRTTQNLTCFGGQQLCLGYHPPTKMKTSYDHIKVRIGKKETITGHTWPNMLLEYCPI